MGFISKKLRPHQRIIISTEPSLYFHEIEDFEIIFHRNKDILIEENEDGTVVLHYLPLNISAAGITCAEALSHLVELAREIDKLFEEFNEASGHSSA